VRGGGEAWSKKEGRRRRSGAHRGRRKAVAAAPTAGVDEKQGGRGA
jgi:hypothetical protein